MNDGASRHPEARIMAAFVDGTLAPAEVAAVAAHLGECSDCRTVVSETARFEREESEPASRAPRWWIAVAAVVALVVIAIPVFRSRREGTPIATLITASPRAHRNVDARLSGFPWAHLAAPVRGSALPDPADLKLTGAAGDVLDKTKDAHAVGVAYLLIQRRTDAITSLERAAQQQSNDAHVWNDLAAARYAYAIREEHPSQLPQALADADHALRIAPSMPEALFNRALILEGMQLRDSARAAWKTYLDADSGSAWAVEAREHLSKLEQHSRRFDPKLLDQLPPAQLVAEFPREARRWGEGVLLADWADAPSPAKLARVRALADALVAFNGDHMLDDAVAAIERADDHTRSILADAHRTYRDARIAYTKLRATEAEAGLRRAIALFDEGKSPMADVARFYAAGAALFQSRGEESRAELQALLASIDRTRYRALDAEARWQLALQANTAGDWGAAVREAETASRSLAALHEDNEASEADVVASYALEVIGDADAAWSRRVSALARLDGDAWRDRRTAIIYAAACALRSLDRRDAADAVLGVLIAECGDTSPRLRSLAHVERARDSMHDAAAAVRELGLANETAARIKDVALHESAQAQIDLAFAMLQLRDDPRSAAAGAERAAAFFRDHELGALVPDALLQRARAHEALGDEIAASDYDAALDAVAQQQQTINSSFWRARFLDTAAEIVDGAIEFHLSRGDSQAAFAIADRAKGGAGTAPQAHVIEYAVLRHSLAIFRMSDGRLTVTRLPIDRPELDAQISSFIDKLRHRAPDVQRASASLHALLIAPLQLNGEEDIIIVPDRRLNALPFAALYDESHHRYLVEDHAIRFAPNARESSVASSALAPAVVVSDPAAGDAPPLLAAREEASRVAAIHNATMLTGETATSARFAAECERAALIHYSGHENSTLLDLANVEKLRLAQHPVVVLAACGTMQGDPTHVAGMTTIGHAFLAAGARSVVGTLWEVDDDVAAILFRRFHERLRAGGAPATALREVQLEMLRSSDERLRQPAAWSPVEVLGHT